MSVSGSGLDEVEIGELDMESEGERHPESMKRELESLGMEIGMGRCPGMGRGKLG